MALSRSLLWFSPSICSQPAATAAIERIKVHFLHGPNPKLHTSLFKAVPWIPRGFETRGCSGELVQVASAKANNAQGRVESITPKEPDGDEGGESSIPEAEVTRKPPRRRRKAKRKVGEETISSRATQKEAAEESAAAELLKSPSLVTYFESNSPDVVVGKSSFEQGVIRRDHIDAATRQKSSSSPSSREVPQVHVAGKVVNGATGGAVTSVSETVELEQGPVASRKKKRRSKKAKEVKEAGVVSNGSVDAISGADREAEPLGRIFRDRDSTNEGSSPPENAPEGVGSSEEVFGASEITPITGVGSLRNGDESISQAKTKNKRRSKKKVVVEPERRQVSERQEVENSGGRGADVAMTDYSVSSGNSKNEGEEQPSPQSGRGSSKTRKRRGRRKATSSQEQIAGSGEQSRNDRNGICSDKELGTGSNLGSLTAVDKGNNDAMHKEVIPKSLLKSLGQHTSSNSQTGIDYAVDRAEHEGSQYSDLRQMNLQSNREDGSKAFQTRDDKKASMPGGRSGNGTVVMDSDMQNQTPETDSEVVGAIADDSIDSAKSAKKNRRRKQRKKKASLVQLESQPEGIEPSAVDLYESIVWCTVHLKVQAELGENERLYVVGANPELGGWDLSLALPLPESDEEGVWENTLKIPRGTMLEYKYFTESQDAGSTVIERWFGPEIQYVLPWKEGPGSEFEVISDTWIPDVPAKLPLLSWGDRWWEDMDSMENNEDLGGYEGQESVGNIQDLKTKRGKGLDREDQQIDFGQVFKREDEALDIAEKKVETPAQEPVIEEWLKKKIRKRVFPREEPWLLESMIMDQRNGIARKKHEDAVEGMDGGTESLDLEQKAQEAEVEILINSPQCTMQRMAILEDGKLVELLLEPVNTRVQVGNVYLGVVRQLLPGMTGVFVDIGGFQLALLDITRNQYPYTFPSIGQSTEISGDGQSWSSLDDDEESDWEESESGDEDEDEDDHDSDFVDDEEGDNGDLEEEVEVEDDASKGRSTHSKGRSQEAKAEDQAAKETGADSKGRNFHSLARIDPGSPGPITVNFGRKLKKWRRLQEGMHIIVQVKKEALGKKGPRLTAFPSLAGRFWVLIPGGNAVGVSRRITGPERKRLRQLAQDFLPANFSLTVRTEALGHDREELEKDLARLMETWKEVLERASSAAVAAEHGMEGAMPVLLHRAMGQFLTIVRDFFNDKVHRMVIDSPQCYQEVTSYLQEVAPQLSDRVERYTDKIPIFDAFDIETEIEKFSNKRVSLPTGGYLVLEETEALVSIDVNGGTGVLSHDLSQEEAILAVNLAAARQIATELRLRDIGGIIVVDFIDMDDPKSEKMVFDEMRKAIARDRSSPSLSEISEFGLMEMTRKRVRPSVTLTISDPCSHCSGMGRVEAHETTLSKIERAVLRMLATKPGVTNSSDSTKWPQLILRVDNDMGEYLKGRKRKRMTQLSAALKVWLNLKVALEFSIGQFQVLEQHRTGSEKRSNGAGQTKTNLQNIGPGLLGKRGVWPGKRRRNFANQVSTKE